MYHHIIVKIFPSLMCLSLVSVQLYRLCWALRNSTEERIDLDPEEIRHEEADGDVDECNTWFTFGFHVETLCT